jgi:alcohol dehydrogenase YqhD (iron-dependent ADH family)
LEDFVFQSATKIIFGKGAERNVGKEVKKYSSKILLHYGHGSIKKYGLYKRIVKSLKEERIEIIELSGVQENPVLSMVKKGIKICKKEKINFILAVGGGSVIDSAKAIAIGVQLTGDMWDCIVKKAKISSALPVGVVVTVPASGSEASDAAVITNEEKLTKKGYHSDAIRPKFSILNPELTYSLSSYQTACGVSDIMSHVMERYFTNTKNVDLSDRLCEATLKTVIENTPLVLGKPNDYNGRAEIMWAATIAHNGLLGMGRVEDWGSHKLGHEISAIYGVAHGATMSVIFPAWLKYVYKKNVERFEQFAVRVFGIDAFSRLQESTAVRGIEELKNFYRNIGLPVSLKDLGIGDKRIDEMSAKCTAWGPVGNFAKLYKEDVKKIFKLAG